MIGFLGIQEIVFPLSCLNEAFEHMRSVGRKKLEGVALFAGNELDKKFYVQKTIVPVQRAYSLDQGLLYAIDGRELHRINVFLYENSFSLIAQIHSHPQAAYHSATDDAYPVVSTVGGLSLVVPNFASGPILPSNWAVYRLTVDNFWNELDEEQKSQLLKIM